MLSEEELEALAEKLAPKLAPKQKTEQQEKAKPQFDDKSNLAEQIAELLETKTKESNQQVFETMWEDKLSDMYRQTEGLEDFMKQEDDYGKVRIERLQEMPYDKRIETIKKLETQYRNAVSNGTAKTPTINSKTQELAESNEKLYNEVEQKLQKNEYSSIEELQSDYFNAISTEMDSVLGN